MQDLSPDTVSLEEQSTYLEGLWTEQLNARWEFEAVRLHAAIMDSTVIERSVFDAFTKQITVDYERCIIDGKVIGDEIRISANRLCWSCFHAEVDA